MANKKVSSGRRQKFQGALKRGDKMERAQVWSIDVMLAVVIFVSIIIVFYVTLNNRENPGLKDLQSEARFLKAELERNPRLGFITRDEVDETKLNNFTDLVALDYQAVKAELGIKGDFCIYYEDEAGNLRVLKDNRTGIGSPEVEVGGRPCGLAD